MYKTPFYLTEPVGNNAFSYDTPMGTGKRINKTLYIPSIITGAFSDLRQGEGIVFEDVDEKGILQSCTGLQNFVRMTYTPPWQGGIEGGSGIPMIVFDNHNHALYFWYEARVQGIIDTKNTLVHIDEHSDLWGNKNDLEVETCHGTSLLEKVFHFTNYQCNVGNYIQPALREGIIEKVLRIEDTIGMEKYVSYQKWENESLILNLDLDFFAPELDYIPFEDKKRTILHFARQAKLITVATSPFFIDQKRAMEMLGKVFEWREI